METIINAMCTTDSGTNCRIWNGTGGSKGFPYFTLNDTRKEKHQFSVISLLVNEKYKISLGRASYIHCKNHKGCVNIDHIAFCTSCAKRHEYFVEDCPIFGAEEHCAICR